MSIIYEALKRIESQNPQVSPETDNHDTQENKDIRKKDEAVASSKVGVTAYPKENKLFLVVSKTKIILILLGLIIICTGVFIFSKNTHRSALAIQEKITVTTPITENSTASIPKQFTLEGIVYDEKLPLAIINGRVYKHYDRLGDYMVVDISEKEVTLRNINDDGLLHFGLPF
jgi:hypothetical protein